MQKPLIVLCFFVISSLFLAGCQAGQTPTPLPTGTRAPILTNSPTASQTPVPSSTLIPAPTTTFPAPLPFHGSLPSEVEARFGLGGFGMLALSSNGKLLAVTSGVGILLYDPETLSEIRILPEEAALGAIDWSPDSKKLAVVASGKVAIWDVEKGKLLQKLAALDIRSVAWSPDGEKLALTDNQNMVKVWDLKLAKPTLFFSEHAPGLDRWQKIFDVVWVDENRIVSVDEAGQVMFWETETGKIIHLWKKTKDDYSRQIALSPDKQTLAINSLRSGKVSLWDLASLRERKTIVNMPPFIMEMAWSPDGQSIALAAQFPPKLMFVDVNSGVIQKEFSPNVYSVAYLAWLKNDKQVITLNGHGDGDVITLWDIQSGQGIRGIRSISANQSVWSADGKTIAASDGGSIVLWDVQSGKPRLMSGEIRNRPLDGGPNYEGIFRIALNPSGTLLAAESGDDGSRVRIWDTATGVVLENEWMRWHLDQLAWVSERRVLALVFAGTEMSTWEAGDWENRRTLDLRPLNAESPSISANGRLAAIGRGKVLEIRDLDTDEIIHRWNIGMKALPLAWSPDATKIAVKNKEKLAIYDVATEKKLNTLIIDQPGFSGFKWRPDSAAIAYLTWTPILPPQQTSFRGTAKVYVWPITAPNAILAYTVADVSYLSIDQISFSPDGKRMALALREKGLFVIRP